MRNLKRALSLTLASVMLLGMMIVGTSAASYPDVDENDNVEAIEVLQAVGVMVGDDNGNFGTDDQVTRAQMAVIMAKLMNLNTYIAGTNPFNDVPEWAQASVAACYANGIVSGYNSTTYGANDPVTAVQAASMLMRALGYFQYAEDYKDGFEIATIRQAGRIDLFNGVGTTKASDNLTRNQVAQIVLNTLKSGMVEPNDGNKVSVNVNGAQVNVGATNYVYIVSREKYAASIRTDRNSDAGDTTGLRNAYIVDLGEKLYQGDLTLNVTEGDDLGRPANHWEYKTKEIGTYADEPDYSFSSKVTSKKLYDTVGSVAATNYQWIVAVNGVEVDYNGAASKNSDRDLVKNRVDDDACFLKKAGVELPNPYDEYTGNGVVTEIYVDDTVETDLYEGRVTVAVYNLYAAEVMRVLDSDGTVILTDLDNGPANATHEFATTLFNEDDVVVYTFSEKADEIQSVKAAEEISGEITRVRTGSSDGKDDEKSGDLFVVNDEKYNYNATVSTGERLQTDTVNNDMVGYLDEFGYCIYIDKAAISYEYAYVLSAGTDQDRYGADPKGKTIYARLAFTDGTTASVETDNAPGKWVENGKVTFENKIVSYSVNSKGVYTLTPATNFWTGEAITQNSPKLSIGNNVSSFTGVEGERYSANSKTAFVLVTTDDDSYSGYSYAAYTGVANVPNVDGKDTTLTNKYNGTQIAVATEKGSRVAKVVFVLDGNVSGGEVYFIRADENAKLVKDSKAGNYYEISAWVDGEAVTLNVKTETSAAKYLVTAIDEYDKDDNLLGLRLNSSQVIFPADTITMNSDELVTGIHTYMAYDSNDDGDGAIVGEGTDKTNRDTIVLGEDGVSVQGRYTYESDAVFTQWTTRNNNGRFEMSRANAIKNDDNDKFIAVTDGDVITGICVWYIPGGEGEFDTTENSNLTVLVEKNGQGTVTVDDNKAAAGETVTVTVKAATGWSVGTVTANNGVVLTQDGDKYTFVMPAGVKVTVTVTFTEDDAPTGGHWEWDDAAGGPVWVPDAALASMAKFARAARAGSGSPFDKYIDSYIRIKLDKIGLDKEYTVFVTVNDKGQTTLKFGQDLTADGKKEIITAMNNSGLGQLALQPVYQAEATEEQINAWKGENPPVETGDTIQAKIAADKSVTFWSYKGEAIKDDQVIPLLTKAIEKLTDKVPTSVAFNPDKENEVIAKFDGFDDQKYTIPGKGGAGAQDKPNAMYKITIGSKSQYVCPTSTAETLKGFGEKDTTYMWDFHIYQTGSSKFILTADKDGNISVDNTILAQTNYGNDYDLTFVKALKVAGIGTIENSGTTKVTLGTKTEDITTLGTTNDYIVEGAKLEVTIANVASKETKSFLVGDSTTPVTVTNTKSEAADVKLTMDVTANKDGVFKFADFAKVRVTLDGKQLKTTDGKDYFAVSADKALLETDIPKGAKIILNEGGDKIVADADGSTVKTVGTTAFGSQLQTEALTSLTDTNKDGVISLSTAYKFAPGAIVSKVANGTNENALDYASADIDATKIAYITTDAATGLYVTEKEVADVAIYGLVAVEGQDVTALTKTSTENIYTISINGEINGDDLKQATIAPKAGGNTLTAGVLTLKDKLDPSGAAANVKLEFTTANLDGATVKVKASDAATGISLKTNDEKVASNALSVTLSAAKGDAPASEASLIKLEITVTMNGQVFELPMTVAQKSYS